MFADVVFPRILAAKELDAYLAEGWFRMGQSVFTTNFLKFHDVLYSALWLRIDLPRVVLPSTYQKLMKQNARFQLKIQPAHITPEHEKLFATYRASVKFETSPSLQQLLYGESQKNIFRCYEINVYDQQKLIATGFFDMGENSVEGISCFYDPAYKKYSLGKYLMFLKIEFCLQRQIQYFYPGYFVPGYPLFDYKLSLAKAGLEYLDYYTDQWQSISMFDENNTPLRKIKNKLEELSLLLYENQVFNQVLIYEYFDANLVSNLNGLSLLEYPLILYCFEFTEEYINPLIVFDAKYDTYHLMLCNSMYEMEYLHPKPTHYGKHLLQPAKALFSCESPELMAHVVTHSLKKAVTS